MVGDQISQETKVVSGCPQGSVNGPILALLFLSTVDKDIENIAQMFCDDTRILGRVTSEEDVENLQNDLEKIYDWARDNNMGFNDKKFEILRYGSNE